MPCRFAIEPQKKLNTPSWECTSNTTRPTRMTRSTLLRQEVPSCHNRVQSIRQEVETQCTAALEFVVAVTCPTVSNAPQQSSLSVCLRATIAHLWSACRIAQWMIRDRNTHSTLKQICAKSACRTQYAKFNNNGNNDRSQYGHHGERVMRYVACKTNFVVHMRGAQRSNSTNSA